MSEHYNCKWPGHDKLSEAERKDLGCNLTSTPEPDACGHGDNPDETCDGCYG